MNELISNKGVSRTAPVMPGLVISLNDIFSIRNVLNRCQEDVIKVS